MDSSLDAELRADVLVEVGDLVERLGEQRVPLEAAPRNTLDCLQDMVASLAPNQPLTMPSRELLARLIAPGSEPVAASIGDGQPSITETSAPMAPLEPLRMSA